MALRDQLTERLRITETLLVRAAENSLYDFVVQVWPILEPHTPFLPNWHIEAMCAYLEAVTAGEITRLVINVPPRYGKSLICSVLWPVWEWTHAPHTRWLFASYSESLATKHSVDRRQVLRSDWYRHRWGHRVRLIADQNEKTEYRNHHGGVMVATSFGGSATGKGGTRIVIDDPHNPTQAESDAQREQAIDFYRTTLSTRLDDKRLGSIVVVMQRLHHADLSAVVLDEGYTALCLPAEAETQENIRLPRSGRVLSREPGEVLWAAREGADELARQKIALGSYGYAGQYQQRPSPRGGGVFKREWWQYFDELPSRVDEVAQSWDLSFKGGAGRDYVVGLVAARRGADIYLIDRFKARASFLETLTAIKQMVARHPRTARIFIEDTANGPAVIDTLRREISGIIPVKPEGGKESRAAACEPRVEAGNVHLPHPRRAGQRLPGREWVDDFVEQMAAFPFGAHDDDVDAFSQLVVRWSRSNTSPEMIQRMLQGGRGPLPRKQF